MGGGSVFSRNTTKFLCGAFLLCLMFTSASADLFEYGDLQGLTVVYLDIREDTFDEPEALFGAPDIVGDKMDFDPTNFKAGADDATPSDIVDGQLNFTVMTKVDDFFIEDVIIEENGDFTLIGLGDAEAETGPVWRPPFRTWT